MHNVLVMNLFLLVFCFIHTVKNLLIAGDIAGSVAIRGITVCRMRLSPIQGGMFDVFQYVLNPNLHSLLTVRAPHMHGNTHIVVRKIN